MGFLLPSEDIDWKLNLSCPLDYRFCLYNNVAVAARAAIDKHSLERILIVDWDGQFEFFIYRGVTSFHIEFFVCFSVHHGNGTQRMFESDPNILYFSVHMYLRAKFYPHSTDAGPTKVGKHPAEGTTGKFSKIMHCIIVYM